MKSIARYGPRLNVKLLDRLSFLVTEKMENSNQVMNTLYQYGKDSALDFIQNASRVEPFATVLFKPSV